MSPNKPLDWLGELSVRPATTAKTKVTTPNKVSATTAVGVRDITSNKANSDWLVATTSSTLEKGVDITRRK